MLDNTSLTGAEQPESGSSEYNALRFLVAQVLAERNYATLVKVVSVTNSGGVEAVGFVDVQPLVNQVGGTGLVVPHGVVHNLPYFRLQGGGNGVILDPVEGDIGIAVFADRDISAVKVAKGLANPGSARRSDMADGLYLGGFINGTPTQYIQFSAEHIRIFSPTAVVLEAPVVTIDAAESTTVNTPIFTVNGNTVLNGNLSQGEGESGGIATMLGPINVVNDVIAGGVSLINHTHPVNGGAGTDTGPPNP